VFFFQAEDGIRDRNVTGVQTCALPILTEEEVEVYATEYGRTGFTGALQGYRVRRGSNPKTLAELLTFSGRSIDAPSMYIAGKSRSEERRVGKEGRSRGSSRAEREK